MNPKPNTVFLMLLLVAFIYSTIVTAAPAMSSTSDLPFDLLGNSSTDVYNNKASNYSQRTDFTVAVKHEPSTILNVTDNGSETTTGIITAAEFTAYGPNSKSTIIVVVPNLDSGSAEMDFDKKITNSTMNDSFATHKSKINSTVFNANFTDINSTIYESKVNSTIINGSTIALQQLNFTAENESNIVPMYDSELNCTENYSTDSPQQSNSPNNTSVNSMVFSTTIDLKPKVSNSTETNTFTVSGEYAGLQLGSEENISSDTMSVISNRKVRTIINIPVFQPREEFCD